ncbi:uncharacterized protein LACBIDRAFT_333899 [Laccaria bicolor S238N-H82]|uniref:Predicted protein n=1 Tax=Laccaria bicolor (strain S238N-H82 / ATCC MYA-4686) TaxID=486041 RepID=B0DXF7_LACBS|nr:uncharacterized protein LACBIDRAFT_333899 [Laccaria bicolor S238N-H82]EDR00613.1 predicted protein [Laccaria bicolor S238N-H82]|eukprot:XP_001888622.1 predicted protein [Laccaria bicolor S238N-H82]
MRLTAIRKLTVCTFFDPQSAMAASTPRTSQLQLSKTRGLFRLIFHTRFWGRFPAASRRPSSSKKGVKPCLSTNIVVNCKGTSKIAKTRFVLIRKLYQICERWDVHNDERAATEELTCATDSQHVVLFIRGGHLKHGVHDLGVKTLCMRANPQKDVNTPSFSPNLAPQSSEPRSDAERPELNGARPFACLFAYDSQAGLKTVSVSSTPKDRENDKGKT